MTRAMLLAASLISLAGCNGHAVPTEHYFETHAAERKAVIERCRDSDGAFENPATCDTASRAERIANIKADANAGGVR